MNPPFKTLPAIAAERGFDYDMVYAAARRRELRTIKPGGGKHCWRFTTDEWFDDWLQKAGSR